jgi:hypothetical protein
VFQSQRTVFSSCHRNASALVIAEHEAGKLTPGTLSTINAASQLKGDVRNDFLSSSFSHV